MFERNTNLSIIRNCNHFTDVQTGVLIQNNNFTTIIKKAFTPEGASALLMEYEGIKTFCKQNKHDPESYILGYENNGKYAELQMQYINGQIGDCHAGIDANYLHCLSLIKYFKDHITKNKENASHGDLSVSNVVYLNGQVEWIIDWENFNNILPAYYDLVYCITEIMLFSFVKRRSSVHKRAVSMYWELFSEINSIFELPVEVIQSPAMWLRNAISDFIASGEEGLHTFASGGKGLRKCPFIKNDTQTILALDEILNKYRISHQAKKERFMVKESISQLRVICQASRPSIFTDFLSQFYYKVSIYFTWVCLNLGMNANQVTFLSALIAILGGFLISNDSAFLIFAGALCFQIFAILDMSDGEVARYRKEGGVQGHYMDWFMHFITPTALVMGLFLASLESLSETSILMIGLLAILVPIMSKTVQNAGWTVICWTLMRDKLDSDSLNLKIKEFQELTPPAKSKQPKWMRRIIFLLLTPFQDRWCPLLLLLLSLMHIFTTYLDIFFLDYRLLLLLYIGVVGPIYLFWEVYKITHSAALIDGYQRLIDPRRKITLPEDDFLG